MDKIPYKKPKAKKTSTVPIMGTIRRLAAIYADTERSAQRIQDNTRVFAMLSTYAHQFDLSDNILHIAFDIMLRYLRVAYFGRKNRTATKRSLAVVCLSIAEKWEDDPPYQRDYADYGKEIDVPAKFLKSLEARVLKHVGWKVYSPIEERVVERQCRLIRTLTKLLIKQGD